MTDDRRLTVDVLAFGPHPDDVELTMGGTMLKLASMGYRTAIVDLTAGEMGTRGSREIRAEEAAEAARLLEASVRRNLDLGDGRLTVDTKSKKAVVEIIRELKPRLVFTNHWENAHPDHSASGYLVEEAAYLAGLARFDAEGEPHRPNRVIYYLLPHKVPPSFIVDISEFYEGKMRAVGAYRSQLHDGSSHDAGVIINQPGFLGKIESKLRYYGTLIDAEYGEPFYVREALKVDDPLAFFDRPFTRFM
jgi:bacillithiol biosynthesis deacetylase BshB1